jgi:hypothetical protein
MLFGFIISAQMSSGCAERNQAIGGSMRVASDVMAYCQTFAR